MFNILKKLSIRRDLGHPELYRYIREFPRFDLPTADHFYFNGKDFLLRDISLSGLSLWMDADSASVFLDKEEIKGELKFFDGDKIELGLRIVRFDKNVIGLEILDAYKISARDKIQSYIDPTEVGKSMKFIPNSEREVHPKAATYWYTGRMNSHVFIWVKKDKVVRWQVYYNHRLTEYHGSLWTAKYDEFAPYEISDHKAPLMVADSEAHLPTLKNTFLILKNIKDELGLIHILIEKIKIN